ncbi:hypothetical protein OsJ_17965 [Oryza sativa Japonica Group]|uniref:TLC domain-containing protein n=1 Tax=Oryza sativa subsp. japonica TaxID=39947 RepID=B9FK54_ORYSJ|nr:hypothetical protein OsJ_17965 [Oryza sativa Japonica Group]
MAVVGVLDSLAAEERWLYPGFLAMYAAIYCVGQLALLRRWAWPLRLDGASCLISLAHGTPAALAAAGPILALPPEARGFAAPNTRFQDHVLDYSFAYFTMDLLHYLAFLPGDTLFIAQHVATLFVFVTCRYLVRHGAYALLVLLVLAEVTSLLQNVWTLAGIWRAEKPAAARVYRGAVAALLLHLHRRQGRRRPALLPQDEPLLPVRPGRRRHPVVGAHFLDRRRRHRHHGQQPVDLEPLEGALQRTEAEHDEEKHVGVSSNHAVA